MERKATIITITILALLISIMLFFVTRFSDSSLRAQDGYFVTGVTIDKELMSDSHTVKRTSVDLVKMNDNDQLYSNLGHTYVGDTDHKVIINTKYPIFTNNGLAIVNTNGKNQLISSKFEYFDSYENFTITNAQVYNYAEFDQADYEKYFFLLLENGSYVNTQKIELLSASKKMEIPLHSIINFQDDYIKYYYYEKSGKLLFQCIEGISLSDSITIGEHEFSYEELLVRLGLRSKNETTFENLDDLEEEYVLQGTGYEGDYVSVPKEKKYVKPSVSVEEFNVNVYSATSKLTISDPAGVITGAINFQFFIGDKLFSRKAFVSSGKLLVTGLVPNTDFHIVGSYKYYNEENTKMESIFFEQDVHTGDFQSLDPIELSFENGPIFSNKIQLDNIKIISSLDNEALKGINKAVIFVNDNSYGISSSIVQQLSLGKELSYATPTSLKSNQVQDYQIVFYDGYGNALKIKNNIGSTRTSKEVPTASFKVVESSVNSTKFVIQLKNVDEVVITNYHYVLYKNDGTIIMDGELNPSLEREEFENDKLDPNCTYNISIIGNYDILDGNGVIYDAVLGEGKFTTLPLSSLGYLRVNTLVSNLTYHSASVEVNLDLDSINSILLQLLSSFEMEIKDIHGQVVYNRTLTNEELLSFKAGEKMLFEVDGLTSISDYDISFKSYVTQGSTTESIAVISSVKKFRTLKNHAYIDIKNQFVNNNMIDFDVRIVDVDGAIESDHVLLEVRDPYSKLIAMESLKINEPYIQLSYTKLEANVNYTFKYYAEEYNIGYDNSTFEGDYTLRFDTINTEDGITGSIELQGMLRQITGDNLFNIEDYDRLRKEGNTGYKKYDLDNNAVMFGGKNGYVNFSYYLPEAYGKSVTVSFLAKYDKDTPFMADAYLANNYGNNLTYKLNGLTKDYKEYTFSFDLRTNYIGFLINAPASRNERTNVWFKDIKIISTTDQNTLPITVSYHPSGYRFTNTVMYSGREYFTSFDDNGSYLKGNPYEGHARITNTSSNEVYDFNYTGNYQTFKVPNDAYYRVELWGASGGKDILNGGSGVSHIGGAGAYTAGDIYLTKNDTFYIYVGGKGTDAVARKVSAGGYNGGGSGDWDHGDDEANGGGGGATDIRVVAGEWDNEESLKSRIMVAAGGGGASDGADGGAAGALSSFTTFASIAATQINGYAFGIGQNGILKRSNYPIAGGGGGWYGGYATDNGNYNNPGSGGSSYISGYAGCVSYDKKQSLPSVSYDDQYKEMDEYLASFKIHLIDKKSEIVTNDYYVRIYLDGNEIKGSPFRYDLIDHQVIDEIKQYSLRKNKKYTITLAAKIRNRFYDIDSININTNSEIRSIRTEDELFDIHPNGKYVVVNDLDISRINRYIGNLYGEIDFQGHILKMNWNGRNYLFQYTRGGSVVKNVVIDLNLDNPSGKSWTSPFILYHYGTLDNVQLNITECTNAANYASGILTYANYSVVKNFVIHNYVEVHARARFGLVTYSNQGLIKDGYVYGEDINAYHESPSTVLKDTGSIAAEATTNSRIQRVFSLIQVNRESTIASEQTGGNLVGYAYVGKMDNSFSVEEDDTSTNLFTQDPNFGRIYSMATSKVYYFSKKNYSSSASTKLSFLALYDVNFLNSLLNREKRFNVDNFVSLGYYPQLIMNDCMPNLDWIPLPNITDEDLIDVTSVVEESNDGSSAIIQMFLNNPAHEKITSVGIQDIQTVEVLDQDDKSGKTTLRVKISNPMAYKSKYYLRKLTAQMPTGYTYDINFAQNERALDIVMYYPVDSLDDWMRINRYPSENYILTKDLDFSGVSENSIYISNYFNGIFNGNGHTIKNITINTKGGVFNRLNNNAVMKNLFIENYDKSKGASSYGGFIYETYNSVTLDNIHMTNVKVKAASYLGALVGVARGSIVTNCSVTDFKSYHNPETVDIRIGGLIGQMDSNGYIANCFVQNVDIDILDSISTYGIGGLVGYMSSGSITNVYATGSIKSNSIYVGGIAGYASAIISNCWSNVNIYTELDYVGGIIGKRDHENISSTLVLGATYSNYPGQDINRTSGNSLLVPQKNYFWDQQPFYGFIINNSTQEKPLSTEQLKNVETYYDLLDFENNFDYTGIEDGILPKLNSTSGELLPNQRDNRYSEEMFNIKGSIDVSQRVEDADIYFIIDNPNNYEITNVQFDYLKVETNNLKITNNDGYTIVSVSSAKPIRYYDAYTLTSISYRPSPGAVAVTIPKFIKIDLQFFKKISSYTDWRSISTTTTENYLLTADIDFSGITNINANVSIGRLEGQGEGHTIKNITIDNISTSFALIKKITTSLKNVTFENIKLTTKSNVNIGYYCNIIRLNFADADNVLFKDITINAPNVSNYVAPIGINRAQSLRNITIRNNHITGKSYVGGLLASSQAYDAFNINAYDTYVYGSENCVGGIVGYRDYSNPTRWFYFTATGMNVTGKGNTGGIFGYGGANYTTITHSTVTGLSGGTRLGGIAGYNYDRYAYYYDADDITVIGENVSYVGGMFGQSYDTYYCYIKNSHVTNNGTGETYTGGFQGYKSGYTNNYTGVLKTDITSQGIGGTGGLFGHHGGAGGASYSYVTEVTINGVNNVGGAIGYGHTSRLYYTTVNVKIIATGAYVGGVYGYIYDTSIDDTNYSNVAHEIILENSEITGGDYVALFSGRTPGPLINDFFYNVYLVGNVATTGASARKGVVTPLVVDSDFNVVDSLPRFYVYEENKIDGDKITGLDYLDETLRNVTTITASDLATYSYYTTHGITTSYFNFTDTDDKNLVTKGYYPFVKTATGQTYVKLPTGAVSFELRPSGLRGVSGILHELPKLNVYSSGIHTINIEFDSLDQSTRMEVYEDDKIVFDDYLTKRTYTFYYDYVKPVKIVLKDNKNEKVYTYEANDLRNLVTTFKNSYAYIYGDKLKGNVETIDAKVIHLYNEYALTDNFDVYDLSLGKYVSKDSHFSLEDTNKTESLFHFELGSTSIDTYTTYSIIHKPDGDVLYDGQLFYKNGSVEIVDLSLDNVKTTALIDYSGDKSYVTILGNDGIIYHLKNDLRLPDSFTNKNIKAMSHNINNDSNIVVIMYENGRVVVFDYRTGNEKTSEKAIKKVSFFNYVKDVVSVSSDSVVKDNTMYSYSDSLDLVKKLEKKPIVEDGRGNYIFEDSSTDKPTSKYQLSSNYTTYYNASKNSYDVINMSDIILGDEKDIVSENDKIYSSNELVSLYMKKSAFDKTEDSVSIIVLFSIVFVSIIITLGLWFKNAKDLKVKEES